MRMSRRPRCGGRIGGFRDAKIEQISESKELNFLLVPFLSHKLPSQMKLNAADMMRKVLSQSVASTGYTITSTPEAALDDGGP